MFADVELAADRGKDQPHLAAGNHANPDAQTIEPGFQHSQCTNLLSQDGGREQYGGQAQDRGISETAEINLHPHHHEEDRYQQVGQRDG